MDELTQRLDRFENRLDHIGKTLETLARVEERQFMQTKTLDRMFTQLTALESRVDDVESKVKITPMVTVLWSALVIAGGVIGFLFNHIQLP